MNLLGVGGHVGEGSGVLLGGGEVEGVGDGLVGRGAAHHPQHQLQVRHLGQHQHYSPFYLCNNHPMTIITARMEKTLDNLSIHSM